MFSVEILEMSPYRILSNPGCSGKSLIVSDGLIEGSAGGLNRTKTFTLAFSADMIQRQGAVNYLTTVARCCHHPSVAASWVAFEEPFFELGR